MPSYIISTGAYLPSNIVSNDDVSKNLDTDDEWIQTRTGIKQRHIAPQDIPTSYLATQAAKEAIKNANLNANKIDMIIVATTTPDHTFPSVATQVQHQLGISNHCPAFDIQAVCSGFIYALSMADAMLKAHNYQNILVIGADKMSNILNWTDRSTCILFGDGAGAALVSSKGKHEVIVTSLSSQGRFKDILYTDGGAGTSKNFGYVKMQGNIVFRHATSMMYQSIQQSLEKSNLTLSDIDYLIPHQANARIIESLRLKLRITPEQIINTVAYHANTAGASIPLALHEAVNNNLLSPDSIVVMSAVGAGLTYGSAIIKW